MCSRVVGCLLALLFTQLVYGQSKLPVNPEVKLELSVQRSRSIHAVLLIVPRPLNGPLQPVRVRLPGDLRMVGKQNLVESKRTSDGDSPLELSLQDPSSAGKLVFEMLASYAKDDASDKAATARSQKDPSTVGNLEAELSPSYGKDETRESVARSRFQIAGIATELRLNFMEELIVPTPSETIIWLGKEVRVFKNTEPTERKLVEPDFDRVIELRPDESSEPFVLRYVILGQLLSALVIGLIAGLLLLAFMLIVVQRPTTRRLRIGWVVALVLLATIVDSWFLFRSGSPNWLILAAVPALSLVGLISLDFAMAKWACQNRSQSQSFAQSIERRTQRRNYQQLELTLRNVGSNRVQVTLISPSSGVLQHDADVPVIRAHELQTRFTNRRGLVLGSGSKTASLKSVGSLVFDTLIQKDIRHYFAALYDSLQSTSGIRICFKIADDVLIDIPWELACFKEEYLALRPATPMLRLITHHTVAQQGPIDGPMRILAVTSTPNDPRLARIDAKRERRKLEMALDGVCRRGDVQLEWLEHATIQSFSSRVKHGFHVVHFIGHAEAKWNEQEGVLFFEDDNAQIDGMSAEVLAVCLKDSGVRFLFLNACETGEGDGSVAKILVERAVPVAVGMQSTVADDIAIALASEFYGALADGLPIDAALVEGRKAIVLARNNALEQFEWCTPVLYSQSVANCQLLKSAIA